MDVTVVQSYCGLLRVNGTMQPALWEAEQLSRDVRAAMHCATGGRSTAAL